MPTFSIKADADFEADDIDDALLRLAKHFISISISEPYELIKGGEITVFRVDGEDE